MHHFLRRHSVKHPGPYFHAFLILLDNVKRLLKVDAVHNPFILSQGDVQSIICDLVRKN